jgi:ActR/RegA family two-component response regulator
MLQLHAYVLTFLDTRLTSVEEMKLFPSDPQNLTMARMFVLTSFQVSATAIMSKKLGHKPP